MNDPELKTSTWRNLCKEIKRTAAPICWYCGKDIDRSLSGRTPEGWSLDHLKPRRTHPHLVYERSNLRPAHLKCNSSRAQGDHQTATASRTYG